MTGNMHDKVVFITGGGSGIGAASARRMAEEGGVVVVCGRREAPLKMLVEDIIQRGGRADHRVADVSDENALVCAIESVAAQYGRLDVLVNNAMAYTYGAIEQMTSEDWHANFNTTVDGTFWGTRTAVRLMKQTGGGAIVNLASICGVFGTAWMSGYSAAKAAVINFSRAVASEGAAVNIRCNVVVPGVVQTPATAQMLGDAKARANTEQLIPMRRVGRAEEIANAVVFLASDEASYITGACLAVDGGRSADLYTVLE